MKINFQELAGYDASKLLEFERALFEAVAREQSERRERLEERKARKRRKKKKRR